jgi:hypothetical protein
MINERARARRDGIVAQDFSSKQRHILETIEMSLATEITFLYFLNLNLEFFYPVGFGVPIGNIADELAKENIKRNRHLPIDERRDGKLSLVKFPHEKLLKILNADSEIRDWFCPLVAAALRYQADVLCWMEKEPMMGINKLT